MVTGGEARGGKKWARVKGRNVAEVPSADDSRIFWSKRD